MGNPYVIRVVSKKGGVGKTVVAINLAIALASFGKKVLLDDGDVANASASIHIGLRDSFYSSEEVLYSEQSVSKSVYRYDPGSIDILPGTGYYSLRAPPTEEQIASLGRQLSSADYDFVVVDTSPGFFMPHIAKYYKEALIVSTMDEPAIRSNMGLAKLYGGISVKTNMALNRVTKIDDRAVKDIEREFGKGVIGILPEDPVVPRSIDMHTPAFLLSGGSKFSMAIKELALRYLSA